MINQKNQHGKQDLFLLAIFIFGILLCYAVVSYRNRIVLTEPIELKSTGLSVPLPTGRIWHSDQKWNFIESKNNLTLVSTMRLSGKVEGQLICYYQLAAEKIPIADKLTAQAEIEKAGIADKGTIQLGWTTVEWIQLKFKGSISDSFVGIADLPDGRSLKLVAIMESDPKGAWKLFSSVCEGMKFQQNNLSLHGNEFVTRLKDIGTKNLIKTETDSTNKRVYLINLPESIDKENQYAGFAIEAFSDGIRFEEPGSVSGESFYHSAGKRESNNNTIFEISKSIDSFLWQSRYSGEQGKGGQSMRIELSDEGSMKVVNLFTSEDSVFWPSSSAIPEMIIDSAAKAFIDIESEPVIIDLIFPRGLIMPTILQMASDDDLANWPDGNARYGVSFQYLNSQNMKKYIFFDADKKILGKVNESTQKVLWQKVSGSELLEKEQFQPWHSDIARLLGIEQ